MGRTDKITNFEIEEQVKEGLRGAVGRGLPLAFGFDRVSNQVQKDGVSLEFQETGAVNYAYSKGLHIVFHFQVIETAHKNEQRKIFRIMIDLAIKYNIKHLIFKNTSRYSRNYMDLARLEKLIRENDFSLHLYQTNRVLNNQTSHTDWLLFGVELVVAKHHSDQISGEVKAHNQYKAGKGIAPGRSPYGYVYDLKNRHHLIDDSVNEKLNFIFDEFDNNNYSLNVFVDLLNSKGFKSPKGKRWQKSQLHYLLTNPFYHGEFIYDGKIWPGNHEPYYNKERYENRLKRLAGRFVAIKQRDFDFLLARFIQCKCGKLFTGDRKKQKYIYYRHVCENEDKQIYLQEDKIFNLINSEVESIVFTQNFSEQLKKMFAEAVVQRGDDRLKELKSINQRISMLEGEQQRLLEELVRGDFSRDMVKKMYDQHQDMIDSLNRQKKTYDTDHKQFVFRVSEMIDTIKRMPEIYRLAPKEGKIEILRTMASGIIIDGKQLSIKWIEPYSFLLTPEIKKTAAKVRNRPILLPRLDSNQRPSG